MFNASCYDTMSSVIVLEESGVAFALTLKEMSLDTSNFSLKVVIYSFNVTHYCKAFNTNVKG